MGCATWSLKNYLLFKIHEIQLVMLFTILHVQQANNYAWAWLYVLLSSVLNVNCSQRLSDAKFFTACSMMHTINIFSWSLFLMLCSLSINSWALKCLTKATNLPILILHCSFIGSSPTFSSQLQLWFLFTNFFFQLWFRFLTLLSSCLIHHLWNIAWVRSNVEMFAHRLSKMIAWTILLARSIIYLKYWYPN